MGEPAYGDAAKRSADFVLSAMRKENGQLYRRYRLGESAFPGFLEDYAFMVWGLIELYESTFEVRYLKEALGLNDIMHGLFRDNAGGGFFFVGKDSEQMIVQSKDIYDGATPSGNSVAVMNLMRLARITGDAALEEHAEKSVKAFSAQIMSHPMGFTQFLAACDFIIGPTQEIVVVGSPRDRVTKEMLQTLKQAYLPNKVLLFRGKEDSYKELDKIAPYAEKMASAVSDQPTAFWCQQFTCQEPITSIEKLESVIASAQTGAARSADGHD